MLVRKVAEKFKEAAVVPASAECRAAAVMVAVRGAAEHDDQFQGLSVSSKLFST